MKAVLLALFSAGALALPLRAGDLPIDIQAKFIKILAGSANSAGRVACKDADITAELAKIGVSIDPNAKVAWGSSEAEIKAMKAAGKMVLCGKLQWLPPGGSIAIVEEGGKPQIYLHMGNVSASGVSLADSVLKIGKRL